MSLQTPAFRYADEDSIDYTPPTTKVDAGDVVVLGSIPFVAQLDIAVGALGSLQASGIYLVPKDTSTFTAGDAVYWNATGTPIAGPPSTGVISAAGAATSTASANLMGIAVSTQASGDPTVQVLLTAAKRTTTLGGAVVADSFTGDTSSTALTGLASAQGGTVAIAGGASSTSANAGGPVTITGGAPGATGIGGAVTIVGSIGGATSGAGGAVSMTGGAGTAGNAAGGAASLIGGLGQGSAAGGAITITSGAAGATGVAGAVNISVGAATAGAGSSVTITGGNGAGGTAAGGQVNLVPGTAVSTGIPGEIQVNGAAGLWEVNWQQFLAANVPVTATSYPVYLATRAMRVKAISVVCSSSGTVPTVDVTKDTGTTAPGAGTSVMTGAITFSGTANTVVTGNITATVATKTLAAGDRLSLKWAGTIGAITGAVVNILLVPV